MQGGKTKQMSQWGIGGKLAAITAIYGTIAEVLTLMYPNLFRIEAIPDTYLKIAAAVAMVVGVPLLAWSGRELKKHFPPKELIVTGPFAYVRNPLYSVWLFLLVPAISLLTGSYLALGMPIVFYVAFRLLIKEEERVLQELFPEQFRHYKHHVNRVVPSFRKYKAPWRMQD